MTKKFVLYIRDKNTGYIETYKFYQDIDREKFKAKKELEIHPEKLDYLYEERTIQ